MARIEFEVLGDPEAQGSKVGMLVGWRPGQRHRPTIKLEESGNLKRADGTKDAARAWRARVKAEAERVVRAANAAASAFVEAEVVVFPIDGAVRLLVTFTFERPKSHLTADGSIRKGKPRTYASSHDVGDLSKHVRAIEDALADAGVVTDDARISIIEATKVYAPTGGKAGVRIVVEAL